MTLSQLQEKALELPESERLQLAEMIWDSLEAKSEVFHLTEAQRQMLDQRRGEILAHPESALTWDELKAELGKHP